MSKCVFSRKFNLVPGRARWTEESDFRRWGISIASTWSVFSSHKVILCGPRSEEKTRFAPLCIILIWQNTFKFNHRSGWEIVCLFALSQIKWNKAEGKWKGHLRKVGVQEPPFSFVMGRRATAISYEWKWPWNANSHRMSECWLNFREWWLVNLSSHLSFLPSPPPCAPIIINSSFLCPPPLPPPLLSVQCRLNFTFWHLTLDSSSFFVLFFTHPTFIPLMLWPFFFIFISLTPKFSPKPLI